VTGCDRIRARQPHVQRNQPGLGSTTDQRQHEYQVAEAAAVPVRDELRGRAAEIYVALTPGYQPNADVEERVRNAIETIIGQIARPRNVWIVPDMPKTR
jgi:acyl-coenzyme A synthetase/AMP-(fatty) acid ligase